MKKRRPAERIFIALDVGSLEEALPLCTELAPHVGGFKVGAELFTAEGPAAVTAVRNAGAGVFLDLKYHDIPNTVRRACRCAARTGVDMLTVHAAGGREMIRAAREGVEEGSAEAGLPRPLVLAVTVLTSISEVVLRDEVGVPRSTAEQVGLLARLACGGGADGVVCSPREIGVVREACGPEAVLVVPGIRPAGVAADDQKRTAGPGEAVKAGADFLVVGRPVTRAADRVEAVRRLVEEMVRGGRGVRVESDPEGGTG